MQRNVHQVAATVNTSLLWLAFCWLVIGRRYTTHTIRDRRKLEAVLEQIREPGYAIDAGGLEQGYEIDLSSSSHQSSPFVGYPRPMNGIVVAITVMN